ncbi:MATE family efflux transporter [Clostridium sp.]|uniref:MATE family efflux transporter n=1 Tax=Clostridium sp. TaxID=1506 RepID=UPI00261AB5E0|nr:MATE family efflux transporter [Clostridium sp.]
MKDLTTGKEESVILKFTMPILIGNIFQQSYNIVDSLIVGNLLGKNALASVSASSNIMFAILLVVMGLTLGINILVARYFGAKDMLNIKKTIDTALIFSFILSLIITILGLINISHLLVFFNIPLEIMSESKTFLTILLIGTISSFFYNTISSILRGMGDSKTPLYFLIASTILNIFLDFLFIGILNLGSSSAAAATVISQTFSFIGCFIYFNNIYYEFKFNIRDIHFDLSILKLTLDIGFPVAIQKLFIAGGLIVIQVLTNGFGTDSVAALAIAGKLDSFAQMPALNLADALSIFTAQNLGANKPCRVRKGYFCTLAISFITCISITIIIVSSSRFLMRLFVSDLLVINIGQNYLTVVGLFYIVYAAMVVTNGILLGIGNSLIPMISTIISLWCVQIPISVFLINKIGISGIWIAIPIGWIAGFSVRFLYYLYGNWRKKILLNT